LRDEYGNLSGEYEVTYSEPVKVFGNISSAQGEMQTRQFGESEIYDKVIVLENPNTPIDEHSILWVDREPIPTGTKKVAHDYVVKKIARSLNSVSIAISKVNVDE
jgi:hypothetical protein